MLSPNYTTLRKRLSFIAKLANDAPLDHETQDAIGREAHAALQDLDELEPDTPESTRDNHLADLYDVRDGAREPLRMSFVESEVSR
jgi:hypothetical protein